MSMILSRPLRKGGTRVLQAPEYPTELVGKQRGPAAFRAGGVAQSGPKKPKLQMDLRTVSLPRPSFGIRSWLLPLVEIRRTRWLKIGTSPAFSFNYSRLRLKRLARSYGSNSITGVLNAYSALRPPT